MPDSFGSPTAESAASIARRVEEFVRRTVIPYEGTASKHGGHGPPDAIVFELRQKAREAGVLTPHVRSDGSHLTQRDTALILKKSGLSPLGPVACNTMAPDEGNMHLLAKVGSDQQKRHFLRPLLAGTSRSAFLMTEPAQEDGAGSDPSMMKTHARLDGREWVINGRKAFITGYQGAEVGILMANTGTPESMSATLFLLDLPHQAITVERVLDTIDSSMPGGHAVLTIKDLRVRAEQVLGEPHKGLQYAQVRLAPARLSHCMRWLGCATRAQEIAVDYVCRRHAFGKLLIDHEGTGFQLADNLIDLRTSELLIDWCAGVIDGGSAGLAESSATKVAVSESLYRVADRCVQVMGGTGVSGDTVVEQIFRELRAFRIYDGPTEVHKWSIAKRIKRDYFQGKQ